MKKMLVVAAMATMSAASAQAADMAVKAPMYVKAPMIAPYSWSGFYLGANVGLGLSRDQTSYVFPALGTAPRSYLGREGALGGAQAGYNWQTNLPLLGSTVLGLETDIQATGMRDNSFCGLLCVPPAAAATESQRLNWFGTTRARVGLATGPVLTYVTGGFAYGGVRTDLSAVNGGVLAGAGSFSQTRTGYTYGSGVEASLGGNWTGKIEYLYLDLGTQSGGFSVGAFPTTFSSKIHENIFRAGLNYRIGGNAAYAAAPIANWSGFYLGGNVGSALARNKTSDVVNAGLLPAGANETYNLMPNGFLGGVEAGYNWQSAAWVFGLETDIQASTQRDNNNCMYLCAINGTQYLAVDQKMGWLGTTRARLGYSVGSSLFYGTGGLAYGGIKDNVSEVLGGVPFATSFRHTKTGYAVGGGMETPFQLFGLFGKNWTSKTEYLYVNLGSVSDAYTFAGNTYVIGSKVQEHIFRTSLDYHFNAPVVAKY